MKDFFVSCPIHFEKELIVEFQNFWHLMMDLDGLPTREALPEFEIDQGGLSFKCSLHLGLQINFFSKIANRVLLRHSSFKARFFDQFEKEFSKIDFSKVFDFSNDKKMAIEIESAKSRLFHEKNLLETVTKILTAKKIILEKESEFTIYLRIFNDIVTVSVDTSGQHLHFRGYRKNQGAAPLRENLAALTLQIAGLSDASPKTILDPFCGAGTILFESALCGYPQLQRSFPFFKFLLTPAIFKSPAWVKNYKWLHQAPHKLVGIEKDLETFNKALLNKDIFNQLFFEKEILFINDDSLKMDLNKLIFSENENLWIVTNPPYGERLSSAEVPQILKRFEGFSMLQGMIILHPTDWKFQFTRLALSHSIPFTNQGLKLSLSVFKS